MEKTFAKPVKMDWDAADKNCSPYDYEIPQHAQPDGSECPSGSGLILLPIQKIKVEEGSGGIGVLTCPTQTCQRQWPVVIQD